MDCQGYLQDNFSDNLENANNLVENENGLGDASVNLLPLQCHQSMLTW